MVEMLGEFKTIVVNQGNALAEMGKELKESRTAHTEALKGQAEALKELKESNEARQCAICSRNCPP